MPGPAIENFEVEAGDDVVLNFSVSAPSGTTLDGAEVKWWASRERADEPDGEPVLEKSVGDGIVITNTALRTFAVTLTAEDTEGLSGRFYHEAEVTDSEGKKSTVTKGVMTVKKTLIPSL